MRPESLSHQEYLELNRQVPEVNSSEFQGQPN